MSKLIGDVFHVEQEPLAECENCGKLAELRPYGKDGASVCFDCAMKDEAEAKHQFAKRIAGVKAVAASAEAIARHRKQ